MIEIHRTQVTPSHSMLSAKAIETPDVYVSAEEDKNCSENKSKNSKINLY